jgi:TolB protein
MQKALPILAMLLAACASGTQQDTGSVSANNTGPAYPTGATPFPGSPTEPRLTNLRMLTHAGQNAEAYFSTDGKQLTFQATWPGINACDQQYIMDVAGRGTRRVSNGQGRTTCGYFLPGNKRVLFASTHANSTACPAPPDMSLGYIWPLDEYDIYTADTDGSNLRLLLGGPGYDAEATISPDGKKIVFTSVRDGDLEIYTMDLDGSNIRRLTNEPGYDGGAFFSPDSRQIVYRASRPTTPQQIADYERLLKAGLVRPSALELFVMNADGSNKRQVTSNGKANFGPYFHPNGRQIIFSSNMGDARGREFDIYLVNVDGTGVERVTTAPEFDGFPMFSPDGKQLVFASNRGGVKPGDTNIFIADWVDRPSTSVPAGN